VNGGWQVRLVEDEVDFMLRTARLLIWRELPDGRIEYVGGQVELTLLEEPEALSPVPLGLRIPADAVTALADAMHHRAAGAGELKRLEEALTLERARVDRILFPGQEA
jgi:hypothetical protein